MLIFPQLKSGAVAQMPLVKHRTTRTIANVAEDGTRIALSDSYAGQVFWSLAYNGLTDGEVTTFLQFFEACEGRLQNFIFLDPQANLLSSSENLTASTWQVPSLLAISSNVSDPLGTTRASRLRNGAAAPLALAQSVGIPGKSTTCFSTYLRSDSNTPVTFIRTDGNNVDTFAVESGSMWQRFARTTAFASSLSGVSTWSIQIPSGASVDVFGLQIDSQPFAGAYKSSSGAGGVYSSARLDNDELDIVMTSPGLSSLRLKVVGRANY